MFLNGNLPPEQLSFSRKNKEWRKKHLDWADGRTFATDNAVRNSVLHKQINYDLLNGKLNMEEMHRILNPDSLKAGYLEQDYIPHYPIMVSKLNILRGEESKRDFDYRLIITNDEAISDIENTKKDELFADLKKLISNKKLSDDEFNTELDKLNEYYTYTWKDLREIRGNALLKHYVKELGVINKYNAGFMDAMAVGEEAYQCDIVSGEPTFERINTKKMRVFRSGYSNRIEDADIVVLEDFWSPGKIIDTYYDSLSFKDMKYIEDMPFMDKVDDMDNIDERAAFINTDANDMSEAMIYNQTDPSDGAIIDRYALFTGPSSTNNYYDNQGNIKVLRVFWKSRRKIKQVTSYNKDSGEEESDFYPENYEIDPNKGEKEKIYWINEAWEGTKIGHDIYVNMRPRLVQYNRISNPSRCHFGIIGSIYNLNESKPFSLVDMMKPYNYMYDAVHDRLNKAIAANWGKMLELDLSLVPKGWDMEKWFYYAKSAHIAVKDSFKEGNVGAATGKLAGAMNNASKGVIDAETGSYIQQHINLLEFIKMEMSEVAGISKQREGQISNRETVGGVERSNLQSSHITEWLFITHDDIKRRSLECLIETAKVSLKGRSKKFQYILPDYALKMMDIDGDMFAECDYGILVDNSNGTQKLSSQLDSLAQAALQNQTLTFSTIMKIYTNTSLADTQRMVEKDEQAMQKNKSDEIKAQQQHEQQIEQTKAQTLQSERELKDQMNQRDNDTKIIVANILAKNKQDIADSQNQPEDENFDPQDYSQEAKDKLLENMRQFDADLNLKQQQFGLAEKSHNDDVSLKEKDLAIKKSKPVISKK